MKEWFFKLLPYLVGVLLGYLVVSPPSVFEALGPLRHLVLLLLLGVLLLAAVGMQIAVGLPRDVGVTSVPELPSPEEARLGRALEELGFQLVGEPYRVDLRPAATLRIYQNEPERTVATVFGTGTVPRRFGFDMQTSVEGDRGALATVADKNAATFPLLPGHFKQVLHGADPARILAWHREGREYLEGQGLRFERPRLDDVPGRIRRETNEQREMLLSNPLRSAALILWRVGTKTSPFEQPLSKQKGVRERLEELKQGRSGPSLEPR